MDAPRPARPRQRTAAALLAAAIALLGWFALAADLASALPRSLAAGHGVVRSLLAWGRFFTIQSNAALAVLMSVAAAALLRGRCPPSASLFRAVLVYMAVTGITYELLLRGTWSPRGVQVLSDFAFHDGQPALMLAFCIAFVPDRALGWGEAGWRDLPWLLAYPAAYLAVTLLAGALGAGYPYDFLDPGKLGGAGLAAVAAAFLLAFLALGGLATLLGRLRA